MSVSRFGEKSNSGGAFWRESGSLESKPKGEKGLAKKILWAKKTKALQEDMWREWEKKECKNGLDTWREWEKKECKKGPLNREDRVFFATCHNDIQQAVRALFV